MNIDIKSDVQKYLSCFLIQKHCCDCTIQYSSYGYYDPIATIIVRDEFGHGAVKITHCISESIITNQHLTPEEKASKIYSELKGFLNG